MWPIFGAWATFLNFPFHDRLSESQLAKEVHIGLQVIKHINNVQFVEIGFFL
jgi:hypothetical protein